MFGMEAAPKFAPSPKNGTTSSPTRRATSDTSDANLLGRVMILEVRRTVAQRVVGTMTTRMI